MPDNFNNNDDREMVCSVCHRSESRAGKMVKMPGGFCLCTDCMQNTIDSVSSQGFDLSKMQNLPPFMNMPFPFTIDPSGLQSPEMPAPVNDAGSQEGQPAPIEEKPLEGSSPAEENNANAGTTCTSPAVPQTEEQKRRAEERRAAMKRQQELNRQKHTPSISFINLSDLQNSFGKRQQVKRRSPEEKKGKLIDPEKVLPPHKLKAKLDEYVVGQEKAKKTISVAVYNHYKRIMAGENTEDGVEIEKSNMLLIGPTGCGKTYIVQTLARLLDVPLAITDATTLTEAGYIGDDIESVLSKLLAAADNDVDRAEIGIVFIDEIDKIAKKNSNRGRDVSGESVQQGLLKLLEGAKVEVPVGASSKNAMVPLTTIDTKNILFICGGAFPELEEIVTERLKKKASIGFGAELKDKFEDDENIMQKVTTEDLRKFGMIPEFLGRLPIVCTLQKLTDEMLVQVLKEPKNAILKQYQKLLAMDEVKLEFEDDALLALTKRAGERETGARGLRSIIEEIMMDIMYEIPKDDSIGKVTITKDYIENNGAPVIELKP